VTDLAHDTAARRLAGPLLAALAVVGQSVLLARTYPAAYLDADLLSYLAYWRDLRAGTPVAFGYTVPKLLPMLLFGPLASPRLALVVSIGIAATGGALLYGIARRSFGTTVAVLASLLYVLDPMRGVLTLRSSVDLAVGVAVLGAVAALQRRAVLTASLMILVAALGKPPALACIAALPFVPGTTLRRRAVACLVPLLALPATMALAALLAGRSLASVLLSPSLPNQHELFVRVAQAKVLGFADTLRLLLGEWFGGTLFAHTWPLVVLGVALYLVRPPEGADEARRPLIVVPLLLACAYLALAMLQPMIVFTRFFWPLALVLSVFAGYAVVWLTRRLPVAPPLRAAFAVALVAALLGDRLADQRWRERIMLRPFEDNAQLADDAVEAIAHDAACNGAAVVPLAYLPLAAWRAPDKLRRGELCAIEDWAEGRGCAAPRCVLVIPDAPTTERARQAMAELVADGFVVEVGSETGALVRSGNG
jgi:hypothetical protein